MLDFALGFSKEKKITAYLPEKGKDHIQDSNKMLIM